MLVMTVCIGPIYFWIMRKSTNTWTKSSHETYGGSMTIIDGKQPKVTWMDPIIKKVKRR